jgi:hypothetical protein
MKLRHKYLNLQPFKWPMFCNIQGNAVSLKTLLRVQNTIFLSELTRQSINPELIHAIAIFHTTIKLNMRTLLTVISICQQCSSLEYLPKSCVSYDLSWRGSMTWLTAMWHGHDLKTNANKTQATTDICQWHNYW